MPDRVCDSTLEKVSFHLEEMTGDRSTEKLRKLVQETGGTAEPTVCKIITTLLKFQGCKYGYADAVALEPCVSRLHAVVESYMHRVGAKEEGQSTPPEPDLQAFEGKL